MDASIEGGIIPMFVPGAGADEDPTCDPLESYDGWRCVGSWVIRPGGAGARVETGVDEAEFCKNHIVSPFGSAGDAIPVLYPT